MVIRKANREDSEGIYRLEIDTFSIPWSKEAIVKGFENTFANYFIAEEDNQIIGYIGVWKVLEEGQITNIAVHKDYRRRGIGKELIKTLMNFGREEKIEVFLLEVRKSNEAAKKLYEQMGFTHLGIRKNYYQKPTEDAVLMEMRI